VKFDLDALLSSSETLYKLPLFLVLMLVVRGTPALVLYRRLLVDAIQKAAKGEKTLMMLDPAQAAALTGPPSVDGIGPTGRWEDYYKEADAARRNRAPWAAKAA